MDILDELLSRVGQIRGRLLPRLALGLAAMVATPLWAGPLIEADHQTFLGAGAAPLSDEALSDTHGKGVEQGKLSASGDVAVILWDERGNGGQRNGLSRAEGSGNQQTVNVIINTGGRR